MASPSDVHINIQQTYQEAQRLRSVADEVHSLKQQLAALAQQLPGIWEGTSARRMEEIIVQRADYEGKLGDNIELISEGLRKTADVYQKAMAAQSSSKGKSSESLTGKFIRSVLTSPYAKKK